MSDLQVFLQVFQAANEQIQVLNHTHGVTQIVIPETCENDNRVRLYFDAKTGRYLAGITIE